MVQKSGNVIQRFSHITNRMMQIQDYCRTPMGIYIHPTLLYHFQCLLTILLLNFGTLPVFGMQESTNCKFVTQKLYQNGRQSGSRDSFKNFWDPNIYERKTIWPETWVHSVFKDTLAGPHADASCFENLLIPGQPMSFKFFQIMFCQFFLGLMGFLAHVVTVQVTGLFWYFAILHS